MSSSAKRTLLWIVVCAAALRLLLFALADGSSRYMIEDDSPEYWRLASNLAAGGPFSQADAPPYEPDVRRTPVYPGFLAASMLLSRESPRAAGVMGVVVSVATVLLLVRLTTVVLGSTAASWAGWWLAWDLTSAAYSTQLLTDALFTLLLTASVASMTVRTTSDRVSACESGALAGLAALCRPIGIFVSVALWPAALWRAKGRSVRLLLIAVVVSGSFVAIWTWRNARVAGVTTVSSIASTNAYFHRAAYVESYLSGRTVDEVRGDWEREFSARAANWTERDRAAWLSRHGLSVVFEHPGAYAVVWARGILRMLGPDHLIVPDLIESDRHPALWRVLYGIAWIQLAVCYGFAARGAAVAMKSNATAAAIPLAIVAYFLLVSGPEMYPRFRVPLMPPLCMLAGAGTAIPRRSRR